LSGTVLPCTEQGIRNAIAAGDDAYTFDCDGTVPVVTQDEIVIHNNVILDGEGKLTVDGNCDHRVLEVPEGEDVTAELSGFTVTRGASANGGCIRNDGMLMLRNSTVSRCSALGIPSDFADSRGGGIFNAGTLTVSNSTVSENSGSFAGGGISNFGTLTLTDSTLSGNSAEVGGGIWNSDTFTITNSTVAGNSTSDTGAGILNDDGETTVTNSTVSGNGAVAGFGGIVNRRGSVSITNSTIWVNTSWLDTPQEVSGGISNEGGGTVTVANSFVDGVCVGDVVSGGYNIGTPSDSCGFDVTVGGDPKVGMLRDNGGPTPTHALLTDPDSVALDMIPAWACDVTTDQRGVPRPQGDFCDVGAFELEHCASAADCNDDNECTEDVCRPEGLCRNTPADDGTLCDDDGTAGVCVGDTCFPS